MNDNMNELTPCLVYEVDDTTVIRYRHPVYIGRWIDVKTAGYRTYTRVPDKDTWVPGLRLDLARGENNHTTAELFLPWPRREETPILPAEALFEVAMSGAWVPVALFNDIWCVVVDHPYEKGDNGVRHYYRIPQDRIEGKLYHARPLSDRLNGDYRDGLDWVALERRVPTHTLTYREEGKDADTVKQVILSGRSPFEVLPCRFKDYMTVLRYVSNIGRIEPIEEKPEPAPAAEEDKGFYWHAICRLWKAPSLAGEIRNPDATEAYAKAFEAIKAVVHEEFLPLLGTEAGDDNVLVAACRLHQSIGVSEDGRFPTIVRLDRLSKYGSERLTRAVRSAYAAAIATFRDSMVLAMYTD